MTATKTKTFRLIKDREIFEDLISKSKKLNQSIKDQQDTLKEINKTIVEKLNEQKLDSVTTDLGSAELVTKPGNVTWDQDKLAGAILEFAKDKDLHEVLNEFIALKPKEVTCVDAGINILPAKKIAKSKVDLVIK